MSLLQLEILRPSFGNLTNGAKCEDDSGGDGEGGQLEPREAKWGSKPWAAAITMTETREAESLRELRE